MQAPEEQETFLDAVKRARKIRHTNIIRIYDSGNEKGNFYYTMPFINGLSLDKVISRRQENGSTFAPGELYSLFSQLAAAIDALKPYGPLCSVKPAGILVSANALRLTGVPDYQGLPHFPYVAMQQKHGLLGYLAPSVQKVGEPVNSCADIYSMAVILGEMLTGFRPSDERASFEKSATSLAAPVREAIISALLSEEMSASEFVNRAFPEEAAREQAAAMAAIDGPTEVDISSAAGLAAEATVLQPIEPEVQAPVAPPAPAPAPAPAPVPALEPVAEPAPAPMVDEGSMGGEEMEISADDFEEELPPAIPTSEALIPPAPPASPAPLLPPAIPVVSAAALTKSRELPLPELTAGEPPKKSRGVIYVILGILLLGAIACGAIWALYYRPVEKVAESNKALDAASDTAISSETVAQTPEPEAKAENNRNNRREERQARQGRGQNRGNSASQERGNEKSDKNEPPAKAAKEADKAKDSGAAAKNSPADNQPKEEPKSASNVETTPVNNQPQLAGKAQVAKEDDAGQNSEAKKVVSKNLGGGLADIFGAEGGAAGGEKAGSCPADMIYIPAGSFKMGTATNDSMRGFDDKDLTTKYVKEFCIDIYEYPNKEGAKVTQSLSYGQALKHCQQKGKRLCKEEEWEKACKGPNNYRFPYGNRYNATQCNMTKGAANAGQYSRCKSGYGVMDMAGNVAEWTSTKLEPDLPDRIYKGGAYGLADWSGRCASRFADDPNSHQAIMGVRCCKNAL